MKKIFFVLITAIILWSCSDTPVDTKSQEAVSTTAVSLNDEQLKNADIAMSELLVGNKSVILQVFGTITNSPGSTQRIHFPFGGYIQDLNLQPGMNVSAGQTIGKIRNVELVAMQEKYFTTKASLTYLENESNRQRSLASQNATSARNAEQAMMEFERARVELKSIEEQLRLAGLHPEQMSQSQLTSSVEIKSPVSGRVSMVGAVNGAYLQPTDLIAEIVSVNPILILSATTEDASRIGAGQSVKYMVQGTSDTLNAQVQFVNPVVNNQGMVEVICNINTAQLRPGSKLTAWVEVEEMIGLVVPSDAVVSYENKDYVFLQKSDRDFEMKEISTTYKGEDFVMLSSQFQLDHQKVVTRNAYTLLMMIANKEE